MVATLGTCAPRISRARQKEIDDEKAAAEKRLEEEKANLEAEELKERENKQMEEQRKKGGTATTDKAAAAVSTEKELDNGKRDSQPDVIVLDKATPAGEPRAEREAQDEGINTHLQ